MQYNDKTVFKYLKPTDNDMVSLMNKDDLNELLIYLDRYYLEYRNNLGFGFMDTFGIEIEIEHCIGLENFGLLDFYLELFEVIGNKKWDSRNDITLVQGREIVSEILTDNVNYWSKVKRACEFATIKGRVDVNCAAHVHAGSHILGDNAVYWYRFFKLWSVYENVIYRFCYGEYLNYRPNIMNYARPAASFYDSRLKLLDSNLNYSLLEMLRIIEPKCVPNKYTKEFGVSYWRMLADNNYDIYEDFNKMTDGCTIELRVPNGTLDEIVWQNYINFFIKMILYCKSKNFDDDILNRRYKSVYNLFGNLDSYSKIYLDQALEFCDMIFNNNLDKLYFLRQYIKSFEITDKPFIKAKKFTYNQR